MSQMLSKNSVVLTQRSVSKQVHHPNLWPGFHDSLSMCRMPNLELRRDRSVRSHRRSPTPTHKKNSPYGKPHGWWVVFRSPSRPGGTRTMDLDCNSSRQSETTEVACRWHRAMTRQRDGQASENIGRLFKETDGAARGPGKSLRSQLSACAPVPDFQRCI